jgi:actin-related protein
LVEKRVIKIKSINHSTKMAESKTNENTNYVVVDFGSYETKVGMSNSSEPSFMCPTIISYPKNRSNFDENDSLSYYIGDRTKLNEENYTIKTPITEGSINDWDQLEKIWSNTLSNHLNIDPANSSLLLVESPLNKPDFRPQMIKMMFESYNFGQINFFNSSILPLYISGKTTGLVVDSGHGITNIVPIFDGEAMPDYIMTSTKLTGK